MKLSIVTTLYYSSPYLNEFYHRIRRASERITRDYQIIFVNDGSPDDSLDVVMAIQKKDPTVIVVDLSRNFGHHKAMMTGLSYACGELIFLLDCDLEEEPEWLGKFETQLRIEGCDVIYGVQRTRKGGMFERISGELFYSLLKVCSGIEFPKNVVTARLMKRSYVKSLLSHREQEVFLAGLWHITGYNQKPFIVDKYSKCTSTYTLRKKLSILVNSVTSFSNRPLLWIFYAGVGILFYSLSYTFYLSIRKIFLGVSVDGWTSLIVSVWLLGGLVIFSIGVVGIYLSKVFVETKNRPYTIVKDIYGSSKRNER